MATVSIASPGGTSSGVARTAASPPPRADISRTPPRLAFGPQADWCAENPIAYSITSSARASSKGGTLMPSAAAALRLMTNSNLVGCITGRSAGLAPPSILPV